MWAIAVITKTEVIATNAQFAKSDWSSQSLTMPLVLMEIAAKVNEPPANRASSTPSMVLRCIAQINPSNTAMPARLARMIAR